MKRVQPAASSNRTRILAVVLCLIALSAGAKGITSEAAISLNGDMPRYLMNGVYFYDLVRDHPGPTEFLAYTYRYFARYPALSLGHHPILLPIAEVPFFALLGVSVAAGRVAMLAFFLVAALGWFFLVRRMFDDVTAFASSLLLVTSPMVLDNVRVVMSDVPALALTVLAACLFCRFVESDETKALYGFVAVFTLACYAKQLPLFVLPALVGWLAIQRGFGALLSRRLIGAFMVLGLLLVPMVVATLTLSPTNVAFALGSFDEPGPTRLEAVGMSLAYFFRALWEKYFVMPVAVLAIVGVLGGLWRRPKETALFSLWVGCIVTLVSLITLHDPRIAIYWVPPFALFAALSPRLLTPGDGASRRAVYGVLALAALYQLAAAYPLSVEYVEGYEEAAAYVLDNPAGATILYSSTIDTGYFVFYVRKGDPDRRRIVLRANKLLATSFYSSIVDERLTEPEEIYAFLDEFGTCQIVVEDIPTSSESLALLHRELASDRFVLKHEIPIRTQGTERHEHPDLRGVSLRIYEYKECREPNLDAILHMDIPMMADSITVTLGDLVR